MQEMHFVGFFREVQRGARPDVQHPLVLTLVHAHSRGIDAVFDVDRGVQSQVRGRETEFASVPEAVDHLGGIGLVVHCYG